MSTPSHIVKNEYWIRVNLAIQICVKEALIHVLHNLGNVSHYTGLPQDPNLLYQLLLNCKQDQSHPLHKAKLSDEQWNILCPITQQTDSKVFDITLLVAVIRSVIGLKPKGGWNIKSIQPNDTSIGAFVFLAKMLRNEIKHGSADNIQSFQKFQHYWKRIRDVLVGLQFNDMGSFDVLETCSLDKHMDTFLKMVSRLEKKVDLLRNEAANNTKDIQNMTIEIQTLNELANQAAVKSELATKANKKDISGIVKFGLSSVNLILKIFTQINK